jgi:dolichyl-phosphate-mannose-protein mannosyltransferase
MTNTIPRSTAGPQNHGPAQQSATGQPSREDLRRARTCRTPAIQDARFRWLLLAGTFLGFGFLTKQLQVLLVVPGLAAGYLLAAPVRLGKRVLHLAGAGAALAVSARWWAAVELIPVANRPTSAARRPTRRASQSGCRPPSRPKPSAAPRFTTRPDGSSRSRARLLGAQADAGYSLRKTTGRPSSPVTTEAETAV